MTLRSTFLAVLFLPAALAAQAPMTLHDAVVLGRARGVQGAIARLNARAADRRAGERTADLLPSLNASAGLSRQTNNLTEFGLAIPGFPPVTDPFTLYALRARATQVIFDGSTLAR
ncbi:MAG TPA: hypothetical protein VFI13_07570, partial [Gemmatimonadales bacterium]|nr:hypothetical protein [Gemmatimonadales bacterium]